MTFNYFGYFPELLYHFTEMSRVFKEDTYICACFETNQYRIDLEFRPSYDTCTDKPLHPLMYCSTGNTAPG